MSLTISLSLIGLLTSPAAAFWRLPCKAPVLVERADPIVTPGKVSGHLHTIMGGNGFDFTMDYNSTQASTCSSCTVIGDHSNYWTPTLFYQAQDGSFQSVDQVGGVTVYYLQRAGNGEKVKAFPPGFRMVAGDPFKRTGGTDFPSQAISYNCLGTSGLPETGGFPNYQCPNGLRAQVFFPSCWNGKDLDSADHKSHMSYPLGAYNAGTCPPEFPVRLVSIFFEIIWDTPKFSNKWYGNNQPFVWSMGDPTGYGGHGDFLMGWEQQHLQDAIDQCTNDSGRVEDCPVFQLIPDNQAAGCRLLSQVNEPISGTLATLPGCNPVQAGPARAVAQTTNCGATTSMSVSTTSFFKDLTSQGWSYVGCGTDSIYSRILTGASTSQGDVTNDMCIALCQSKGFSVAGTEYSRECYCGNSIPSNGLPVAGVAGNCQMPCAGDTTQMCGGAAQISLYQKCTGSTCKNAQLGPASPAKASSPSVAAANVPAPPSTPTSQGTTTPAIKPAAVKPTPTASTSSNPPSKAATTLTTKATGAKSASSASTPSAASISSKTSAPNSATTSAALPNPSANSPPGWSYSGCLVDTVFPRSLPTWSTFNGPSMTIAKCASFCDSKGFKLSGTEYAGQCFCGNSLSGISKASESDCNMACTGAAGQMCGGPARLSVFQKTASSSSRPAYLQAMKRPKRPRRGFMAWSD